MSSRKRSRDVDDDGGDHDIEIETASSSFRQQSHSKRSRVALAAERGGSVVSDEDEDDYDGIYKGGVREDSPAMSSDVDEEPNEMDEFRATQAVQKQVREHRDNVASEQGIVEEVFCRNFMCHSKLRIKLGPLINFIIGHNGSGKSAVLTALTMCLGGKASATNRGASMKSLIKEGEESATLAVKIKNRGEGAYKPELYGESITVERNFTRSGTSGFKIKNAQDKVITNKKADLDDILDFFAFQLDNPINVLTQDMARAFLANSSAADKYKFFIRGTQLEVLDSDYKIMEENLDSLQSKLLSREEDIAVLRKNAEEAKRKKDMLQATRSIRDKIQSTQWMHAWAQVEEQEGHLQKFTDESATVEEELRAKEDEVEAVSGTYEGHDQSLETAKALVTQLQEQLQPSREAHATAKDEFEGVKNQLLELKNEERQIKGDMKGHEKDIDRLKADILEERARLEGAEGEEHIERQAELERLKEAVDEAQQTQITHDQTFVGLEGARAEAEKQFKDAKPSLENAKEHLHDAQRALQRIQQSQGQEFDGYRRGMEQLVRAINGETRWRNKPVGPIGRHIRLINMDWQKQLEKTFGNVLESFICTNKEDQTLLSQIMKRMQCDMQIFIGDPRPLNTAGKEPREGIDTVLRILTIDNPLVCNQLIINQSIDQYALFKTRDDAQHAIYDAREQNVRIAMAPGPNAGDGIRYERTGSGQPKSSPVPGWTGANRMKTDREQQIRIERENVNVATRNVDTAEKHMRELRMALEKATKAVNAFRKQQNTNKIHFQEAQNAVEAQEALIEENKPQDGRLQALESEQRDVEAALESGQSSYQDLVLAKDKLNESARGLKARLESAQGELEDSKARVTKAEKRVEHVSNARHKALLEKNSVINQRDALKEALARTQKRQEEQRTVVSTYTAAATEICQRVAVEPGVNAASLDKRLEKFLKELDVHQKKAGGTTEELTLAWHNAHREYREAKDQVEEMKKVEKVSSNMSSW